MFQARTRQAWIHGVRGVRVTGSDLGEFYKDDNGKLWRYEKRGVFDVEQRAFTDAYGGVSSPWFSVSLSETNAKPRIHAWIMDYVADVGSDDEISTTKPSTTKPSSTPTPKAAPYVPSLTTKASDGSTSLSLGGYVVAAFVVGGLAYAARWAYLRGFA